jgi:hypothetical protein
LNCKAESTDPAGGDRAGPLATIVSAQAAPASADPRGRADVRLSVNGREQRLALDSRNIGLNAAVANAVFHATRVRVRNLPIRIENLIGALLPM